MFTTGEYSTSRLTRPGPLPLKCQMNGTIKVLFSYGLADLEETEFNGGPLVPEMNSDEDVAELAAAALADETIKRDERSKTNRIHQSKVSRLDKLSGRDDLSTDFQKRESQYFLCRDWTRNG